MSAIPYFFLEKNIRGKWVHQPLYRFPSSSYDRCDDNGLVEVDLWPYNGTHELFTMLGAEETFYYPDNQLKVKTLSFDDLSTELQEKFAEMRDAARPRAVNMSDLLLETVLRPETEDYYGEDENAKVPNPLIDLYNRAKSMIDLLEDWDYITSDYRIVYWVTW
jgi:hypothetical protein